MPDVPDTALDTDGDDDAADRELVEHERAEAKEFVARLARTTSGRAAGSPSSSLRLWAPTPTRSTGSTSRSGTRAYLRMPSSISGSRWRLGTPRSKVGSLPRLLDGHRRHHRAPWRCPPATVPAAVATVWSMSRTSPSSSSAWPTTSPSSIESRSTCPTPMTCGSSSGWPSRSRAGKRSGKAWSRWSRPWCGR